MNFQPDLILMVYWVASSFGVMDSATSLEALPSLSKETRRENSRSTGLPPPVSLVLPGISGFCGSELYAVMMLEPAVSPEAALLLEPPQALSSMATEQAMAAKARAFFFICFLLFIRLQDVSASPHANGIGFPHRRDTYASRRFGHPTPLLLPVIFAHLGDKQCIFCYTHVKFRGSCRLGSVFAEFVNQCPHSGHARGKACP